MASEHNVMRTVMHLGSLLAMFAVAASLLAIVFYGGAWMGETTITLRSIEKAVGANAGDIEMEDDRIDVIEKHMITSDHVDETQGRRLSTLERLHAGSGG